jgi:hypothetical protein
MSAQMISPCGKVIVFGAGASKPAGIPVVNEFFSEAMIAAQTGDSARGLEALNAYWQQKHGRALVPPPHIEDGIPYFDSSAVDQATRETNIEEVFEETEELVQAGKLDGNVLRGIKRFIFETISKSGSVNLGSYRQLIDSYIKPRSGPLTLISFNYDTLPERHLLHAGLAGSFSYNLDNPRKEGFERYERDSVGDFDYLKLHGSLNWRYCPRCNCVALKWADTYQEAVKCLECSGDAEVILVPPGKGKSRHLAGALIPVWKKAEERLSQASEIIIIGYSFRESDKEAGDLFSRAFSSSLLKNTLSVTIVDPNAHVLAERLKTLGLSTRPRCINDFKTYVQPSVDVPAR